MKNKVAFGPQARRIASVVSAAAIVGVLGVGGLTISSADVSAASRTGSTSSSTSSSTKTSGSTSTSSSSKTTSGTGTTSIPATSAGTSTPTTTPTQTSTTPNTGIFTGDDEFTKADGLVILTASLTVLLAAYLLIRNRKNIFRGRVNFGKR